MASNNLGSNVCLILLKMREKLSNTTRHERLQQQLDNQNLRSLFEEQEKSP